MRGTYTFAFLSSSSSSFVIIIILYPKMEPVPPPPSPPTSTNSTITCCYSRHCRRFIIISFCIRCTSSICNCSINGYRTKSLAMHDAMAEAIALLSFSFVCWRDIIFIVIDGGTVVRSTIVVVTVCVIVKTCICICCR